MRDWIAGAMAVLGTLLIVSGGAVIVVRALANAPVDETTTLAPAGAQEGAGSVTGAVARLGRAARKLPPADRLIGWGIVLLLLAAIAAGAISFSLSADAGTK